MKNSKSNKICPKCQSDKVIKNGSTNGNPKWKCKKCSYQFSKDTLKGKPKELKRMALQMYMEGLGFRAIERILGVSNVAVLKWVRGAAKQIHEIHKDQTQKKKVETMELDEMWHYISKKNKSAGFGLLMIEKEKDLWPGKPGIVITTMDENSGTK